MRFDFTDLRLFLHVADAASITHGAERAHLALASASARIKGMEEALGVALLTRQRHGVSLTAAGQTLAEHARVILQSAERMRGDLGLHARGLKGQIRILSNTAALSEHLPKLLADFLAANAGINLELEERESAAIVEAIAAGVADIGIMADPPAGGALEYFPFRDDRLMIVAPRGHALAGRRKAGLVDLAGFEFVGLPRGSALRNHLDRNAARLGLSIRYRVGMTGFDAVCRMVEAGVGIAIVPETAARRCRRTMAIEILRLADPWATRKLSICVRRAEDLSKPARRLVAHLRREPEV